MVAYTANESQTSNAFFSFMYDLQDKGDSLRIADGVKLGAYGEWSSIAMMMTGTSLTMGIGARAFSTGAAFAGSGGYNSVTLSKNAVVSGGAHAFNLNGQHNTFHNNGVIRAGYDFADEGHSAILSGGHSYIANNGWIGSLNNYGILLQDGRNSIMNGHVNLPSAEDAVITGGFSALGIQGGGNWINNFGQMTADGATIHLMQGFQGGDNYIFNRGRIFNSTGNYAILSEGDTNDTVENTATWDRVALIKGTIALGDGNDTLVNNGKLYGPEYSGGIVGHIRMGNGNDVVKNYGDICGDVHLGAGNDTFMGSLGGHYSLTKGQPGHVYGGAGNDTIYGSSGNDIIHGGEDQDVLFGDMGQDAFVFDVAPALRHADVIKDFSTEDDRIHLKSTHFSAIGSSLDVSEFCIGAQAKDSATRIIYNEETGALSYDADGSGSAQAVQFATLDAHLNLTAGHFFMI